MSNIDGHGFDYVVKVNKINKVERILKDVKPLKFNIEFEKYDSEDIYLSSVHKSKVSEAVWKEVKHRAYDEQVIGSTMRFPQTLFCAVLAGIETVSWKVVKENVFLRMLKYYWTYDDEPFVEVGPKANINLVGNDSLAPKRCILLLEMFITSVQGIGNLDATIEIFNFLIHNPDARAKKLKDMTSVLNQSIFSKCDEMNIIDWKLDKRNRPYQVGRRTIYDNDKVYFSFVEKSIRSSLKDLKLWGMSKVHDLYYMSIFGKFNDENRKIVPWLTGISKYTGFTRTERDKSHRKQMEKVPDLDPSKVRMGEHIRNHFSTAVEFVVREGRLLSKKEFFRVAFTRNTNKSEGFLRYQAKIQFKTPIPQVTDREGIMMLTLSKKMELFLVNPYYQTSGERLLESLTEERPGAPGNRDVKGGKASRSIMPIGGPPFVFNSYIADPVEDFVDEGRNVNGIDFSVFVDLVTGNPLVDQGRYMVESSNGQTLQLLADYTAFDASMGKDNFRKYKIAGMKNGFIKVGMWDEEDEFLGFKNFAHAYVEYESSFLSGKHIKFGDGSTIVVFNELSGERWTKTQNNFTNNSNMMNFHADLSKSDLNSVFHVENVKYVGDDSVQIVRLSRDKYNLASHTKLVNTLVNVCAENGLEINDEKTVGRLFYSEYLKKTFVGGYHFPNIMQMTLITAENPTQDINPIEYGISRVAYANTYIARGGTHDFVNAFVHYQWMLRRTVKKNPTGAERSSGIVRWFVMPYVLMWTPISLGGIGTMPWTTLGAMKDVLLAYYTQHNSVWKRYCNIAIHMMKIREVNIKRIVSDIFLNGDKDQISIVDMGEGVSGEDVLKPMKDYFEKYVILDYKQKDAKIAVASLKKKGIDIGKLSYLHVKERVLTKAIENNPSIIKKMGAYRNVQAQKYILRRNMMIENEYKIVDYFGKYEWLKYLEIKVKDELDEIDYVEPVVGLDPKISFLYRRYGYNLTVNGTIKNLKNIISRAKRDPGFPRDLTPEAIFGVVTSPNVMEHPELMASCLIAMGLSSQLSSEISTQISQHVAALNFSINSSLFSTNDGVMSNLDFSSVNKLMLLGSIDINNNLLKNLIGDVTMLMSVYECIRTGKAQRVVPKFDSKMVAKLYENAFGRYSIYSNIDKVSKHYETVDKYRFQSLIPDEWQ
jgi:hypothetical protein